MHLDKVAKPNGLHYEEKKSVRILFVFLQSTHHKPVCKVVRLELRYGKSCGFAGAFLTAT